MRQGVLPFQYEVEKKSGGMTSLAGLPAYVEFAHAMGLGRLIRQHVKVRNGAQGWTDEQMMLSLIWLNLAGGDCVSDLRVLEKDEGFCRFIREVEDYGKTNSEKRELKKRWRKQRTHTFSSETSMREYLECFHDKGQEEQKQPHEAYIRRPSAHLSYVPTWIGNKKDGPTYRYLAIREPVEQPTLPGIEEQQVLPFPTMKWGTVKYKVRGIVTNRDIPGDEVIRWHRERCGKSEEAHSIMKGDLAGGKFPSGLFGANAAWWQIMVLAFNLNSAMKRLVLGGEWITRRLKAIRFWLINVPGRVIESGRELFVRLVGGHPSNDIFFEARRRMLCLCDSG
jgi:hypothetical protein